MRKDNLQYANCRSAICELFFVTRILFFHLFHARINVYDFYMNSRFNTKIFSSFCRFNKMLLFIKGKDYS